VLSGFWHNGKHYRWHCTSLCEHQRRGCGHNDYLDCTLLNIGLGYGVQPPEVLINCSHVKEDTDAMAL
jgi:hypothetical protein